MLEAKSKLPFYNLSERHHGLTLAIADFYAEAARVCLDRHHVSPVDFSISNYGNTQDALVEWEPTDHRTRTAWANETDTTEAGAYACALAAVELTNGMVAVGRAETKTGADYYIAPRDRRLADLEESYRLEISGVDRGSASAVRQRLQEKLEQAASGASNLPAIAGVVGFRAKLILLQPLEKE